MLGIARDNDSPLGVEYTVLLENFRDDGDSRVDGVGDDQDKRFGRGFGDTCGEVTNDTSVDLDRGVNVSQSLERVVRM